MGLIKNLFSRNNQKSEMKTDSLPISSLPILSPISFNSTNSTSSAEILEPTNKVLELINAIHFIENKADKNWQSEISHTILLDKKNKFRIVFVLQESYFRVLLRKWEKGTRRDIVKLLLEVDAQNSHFKILPWLEHGFWEEIADNLISQHKNYMLEEEKKQQDEIEKEKMKVKEIKKMKETRERELELEWKDAINNYKNLA